MPDLIRNELGNEVEPKRPLVNEAPRGECCEKESRTDALRAHPINITFHHKGCVITVGCKTVAFSTIEEGMSELNEYVANPIKEKARWLRHFNNLNNVL